MLQGRKLKLALVFLIISASSMGQTSTTQGIFGENSVEYRRQVTGGPYLHTNGIGASLSFGKHTTGFKRRMRTIEIATLKHPKEIRSFNAYYEDSKSYVFGKQNSVILLKPSMGYKIVKYDKLRKSGVEVGISWSVGPTLALLKPVYLEIRDPDFPFESPKIEKFDPEKHNQLNIYGRASGLKGVDEMRFLPGATLKGGLVFEYSPLREGIRAIEVGSAIDIFPKKLAILANDHNKNIFVNFYIQMLFGKKYIQ